MYKKAGKKVWVSRKKSLNKQKKVRISIKKSLNKQKKSLFKQD